MSKKMLIDAGHPEETRVAVLANGKVEDFDFESQSRKPLRGNIYLARVTRVEPSLQAAFVEYGGNRHGFLAFSEIHPDYYQIPVSDREILRKAEQLEAELAARMEAEEGADSDEEAEAESAASSEKPKRRRRRNASEDTPPVTEDIAAEASENTAQSENEGDEEDDAQPEIEAASSDDIQDDDEADQNNVETIDHDDDPEEDVEESTRARAALMADASNESLTLEIADEEADDEAEADETIAEDASASDEEDPETAAAANDDEDTSEDAPKRKRRRKENSLEEQYRAARRERVKLMRNYRIQEVIKRRQILLIQVVKEERGNKGAAVTTYMSLAGRYGVLMPNTARGGGISRKISNGGDRKRLRKAMSELEIPQGMGLIIRTAGAKRTKAEIKRDYDYLTRLWDNIRDLTMKSIAPCLVYEEASLIKRAIRDLYDKDIKQVLVEGEDGYREAKDFMKMLMPSHSKNVQPYKEKVPLFLGSRVESQLDEMYQPVVKLKSGGYLVIQQTEALISIDVNSGRATKERNIESTALKTNLEAAAEVARQCRLRDLAGLVVIDFIDMEENRNNRSVERKLKESMKTDRARIQIGHISNFGLMEMSRQRRRSGIVDGTTHACPTCQGAGAIRSHEMAALRILRAIEEEALKGKASIILANTSGEVALYVLNQKRSWINRIEDTYGISIEINADPEKDGDHYAIDAKGAPPAKKVDIPVVRADMTEADFEELQNAEDPAAEEERAPRKRRRRRRRGGGDAETTTAATDSDDTETSEVATHAEGDENGDEQPKRRRRGRRGGRRNRKRSDAEIHNDDTNPADEDAGGQLDAQAEPAEETSDTADTEEKPKRKRRSRKKAADTTEDNIATEATADSVDTVDDSASPKPAAKKRTRKKAVKTASKDPASDAVDTDEKPTPKKRTRKKTTKAKDADVISNGETGVETPMPEVQPAPTATAEKKKLIEVPEDTPKPAKEKRKSGWWSRALNR